MQVAHVLCQVLLGPWTFSQAHLSHCSLSRTPAYCLPEIPESYGVEGGLFPCWESTPLGLSSPQESLLLSYSWKHIKHLHKWRKVGLCEPELSLFLCFFPPNSQKLGRVKVSFLFGIINKWYFFLFYNRKNSVIWTHYLRETGFGLTDCSKLSLLQSLSFNAYPKFQPP